MAKRIQQQKTIVGGIADSLKSVQQGVCGFESALDFRSDPFQFTVNPRTEKQAGSLISDLPMWADSACDNLYFYGNTGNIYLKDGDDNWSIDHIAPNSVGNGIAFFPEDEYLYYAQSKTIGRKSRACDSDGVYYDGFLESEGGEPTNSQSITFARASSQYASIADNASLSITDDISIESYIKLTTLPATNEVYTFVSKWNEQSNQRSYKFDLTTSSNAFGDGSDGALVISTNTTDAPIDSACSGTSGTYTLTATNASFAAGQKILILQMQGTNAGIVQETSIQSYTTGTITTADALSVNFSSSGSNKAQVIVGKQYTNVTINAGCTWTAKAWSSTTGVGGVMYWFANGTYTRTGTVSANGKGFSGGNAGQNPTGGAPFADDITGQQGENYSGVQTRANAEASGGGGGGTERRFREQGNGGGGGAYGTNGSNGGLSPVNPNSGLKGFGGNVYGSSDLSSLFLGAGGGGGGFGDEESIDLTAYGAGGNGGGIIFINAASWSGSGGITSNGANGQDGNRDQGAGGGGSGGSIFLRGLVVPLGTATITATAGAGGTDIGGYSVGVGGAGGVGRIVLYYGTSYTGTTSPTLNPIQNSKLGNTSGYVLRLLISSNGTNSEIYTQNISNVIETGKWNRWAVTWDAPTSTANFYQNAAELGTKTGSLTQIYNSTARFALATSYSSAGAAENFLNGKMDDTRVWNSVRSQLELAYYNDRVLAGTEQNNSAYYKFEGNVNDSQTYTTTSNLTATNSPTYSTDVPFAGITTRSDQDININAVGSTYTLGTSLSETAANRQTFQPTKEPIKSVQLNIGTKGTGDWTVVIHDSLNREIASITKLNSQLSNGYYEFVFPNSFRPILTANYHVHVYSTVADGTIVSSVLNNMEGTTGNTGAYFATFFQTLVDDIYHPIVQFQNFLVIGNERYVAKLEAGSLYNPHQLTLPAGYRVRCFAKWNEFLAIGVWKGDSITDTDQGKIFLWDGGSDTSGTSSPNTILDSLEGGVNAMQGAAGILYIISGYEGKLSLYGGGTTQKVTQIPLIKRDEYCETAPGAMVMWRSILRFGSTLNTDSETIHKGVYGYGRLNMSYPNSLGFDFPLSLGDQTSSMVSVGCIFPSGQSLYIGWKNGNSYGIDKVSVTNDCYATARLESCIYDAKRMTQKKLPLTYRVDFEALTTGQTVLVYEKKNRETGWALLGSEDTVGATELRVTPHGQINEIQYAIVLESTSGVPVTVIQATLEADDQGEAIAS